MSIGDYEVSSASGALRTAGLKENPSSDLALALAAFGEFWHSFLVIGQRSNSCLSIVLLPPLAHC